MLMIKDAIKARASASLPKHPKKTTSPEGFLKIMFHNKGVEKVGLSGVLNQKLVLETVPPIIQNKEPPCVVYKYTQPIGPQIFNFSQASKSDVFRKPEPCECHKSPFIYKSLGHVLTGDLCIVSNPNLENFLRKDQNLENLITLIG